MTIEELKQNHKSLTEKSDALRAKIQGNTEAARKLNEENRKLIDERKSVLSLLGEVIAEINALESEENRKKLLEKAEA